MCVCVRIFCGGGAGFSVSPPARRRVGYCWASFWCCFCASSCSSCGCPRRFLPQVPLAGFRNPSGFSCLSCSCGGDLLLGLMSLVRRLVFYLVPCSSSGACGLRRLPLGVFCLFCHRVPDLLLRWWRRSGRLPFPCVSCASPAPADLQGFAGFCSLCQGALIGVVTALWAAVY